MSQVSTVLLSKVRVDGKRPGDSFSREGVEYRVIQVRRSLAYPADRRHKVVTESRYGREVWF